METLIKMRALLIIFYGEIAVQTNAMTRQIRLK
jgi:hypothetical protein